MHMIQPPRQGDAQPNRHPPFPAADGALDVLPAKIRNALIGAGITSRAQADALPDAVLHRIRWIGPEAVQQIRALSQRSLRDPAPLPTHERMEVRRHAATIAEEIARGRLAADLTVETPDGETTIGALAARWQSDADADAEDLHLVRTLLTALRYQTLDTETRAILATLAEPHRAIVRDRYDPFAPLSIVQCAARLGRSRERVRMIAIEARDALIAAFGAHQFPRTRTAIHLLAAHVAAGESLRASTATLTDRGLLQHAGRLDDVLLLWRVTGIERPFPAEEIAAARAGLTGAARDLRAALRPRADALSRQCGALTPAWLTGDADAAPDDLRAALLSLGYAEIAPGWLWCEGASHAEIAGVLRAVFVVAPRVTAREMRAVLAKRHGRRQMPTPPTEIVALVAARLGIATIDGDHLKRARRFDGAGALDESDRALADFVRANGPVVTFGELFDAYRAAGAAVSTLDKTLARSPIIRTVRAGLYALIGTPLTQRDIADAAARNHAMQSAGELRYNADGTVTYVVAAGAWLIHSGILTAAELRPFAGEWQTVTGTHVTISPQRIADLRAAIHALDLDVGERIAIRLDTWERTITVERWTP